MTTTVRDQARQRDELQEVTYLQSQSMRNITSSLPTSLKIIPTEMNKRKCPNGS
ncbi:hypothetical protein DPMN_128921 [Dreissena polymorpha]|uniref:Uncharacterized protein n=1 Tax=Dreissena polymorpha TaxID=45954 RepID=A0A9D4H3Z5_DREPO|nr:hypothetical protein DPMN_128921 [Dreissena polymorpha]